MADISTYGDSFRHYVQPGADPDRALRPRNGARGMKCFSGYRRSASLAPPAEITPSNANGMPEGNSVIVRLRSNDDSRSSVRTTSGQPSPWLACPAVAQKHESVLMLLSEGWWRRGESNPRPKILYSGPLRAFPVIWVSSPGTPAGRVPFGPSREKARPSAPREEASGYPVRVTSLRLYGHSTVGGRRLKPPELTDSRWRLLVSRFLRGAGPRHATHENRHPRRNRFAPLQSPL